ncbi:hypothetical protein GCM10027435_04340 [Haloparvum alkalitolerans]
MDRHNGGGPVGDTAFEITVIESIQLSVNVPENWDTALVNDGGCGRSERETRYNDLVTGFNSERVECQLDGYGPIGNGHGVVYSDVIGPLCLELFDKGSLNESSAFKYLSNIFTLSIAENWFSDAYLTTHTLPYRWELINTTVRAGDGSISGKIVSGSYL